LNRREVLKALGLTGTAVLFGRFGTLDILFSKEKNFSDNNLKNWAWLTTDTDKSSDDWKREFALMRKSGIHAVIPEVFNSRSAFYASKHLPVDGEWLEKILPLAKAEGLEVHAWIWAMICNIEKIYTEHPEWYIVNGNNQSILEKPAYAQWYRFLCPSRPEPLEFIMARIQELTQYTELDGIHLDYIRYPEVIIAETLQKKYNIKQDKEYPEYDYCYCEVCRKSFKERSGLDPLSLRDPSEVAEWKQYRYDTISNFVNGKIYPLVSKSNKILSAAVFPPDNCLNVRQQWYTWKIDAFLPMLYNTFYNKDVDWIKEQTVKGIKLLNKSAPLYSGLFIPELDQENLTRAIEGSITGGANGIVLFAAKSMNKEKWQAFKEAVTPD